VLARQFFSLYFVFRVYVVFCLVFGFWLLNASTIDCLEPLVSKMTSYVWSVMLNATHSATSSSHSLSLSSYSVFCVLSVVVKGEKQRWRNCTLRLAIAANGSLAFRMDLLSLPRFLNFPFQLSLIYQCVACQNQKM